MKVFALLFALFSVVRAADLSLKDKIVQSLEALQAQQLELEEELEGIDNCANKCNNVFNRLAYQVSTSGGSTYEWQACMIGCNNCTTALANNLPPTTCILGCKNYDWLGNGLLKGVIEPDKACISGCIIQTCQGVCQGGTTDSKMTAQNKPYWWGYGGCSIKTQPYSQAEDYVPWNSPNTGQGGSKDIAKCCANALSLCLYPGSFSNNINNPNFQQLYANTGDFCRTWVPSQDYTEICTFYSQAQNCGQFQAVTAAPTP